MTAYNGNGSGLRILLFVGFVITGVITTILGPIFPVLISRWSLTDAQAGFFFTTQFVGSMAGVGLSSLLLSSQGYRSTLILGYILMTAGIASLNLDAHQLVLVATAMYGFGFGLVIPATNLWVAENAGPRRSSTLSLLNLCWSVGSLVCPVMILSAVRTSHLRGLLFGIAGAACLLGLGLLALSGQSALSQPADTREHGHAKSILGAIALGLLFFLYSGTETGVSGWVAAYSKRLGGKSANAWELAPMFFWAGLLVGRLMAPLILSRIHENRLVVYGLAAAGVGLTTLIRANAPMMVVGGTTIAGLGLSIVYPVFISWLSLMYGVRARRVGGAMFAFGGAGGAAMPWLVGMLSTQTGSLRIGLLVPLSGCAIMLGTAAILRRRLVLTSASTVRPSVGT